MILINLPYCLAFNALAYRAYTARQGTGDVAIPSALSSGVKSSFASVDRNPLTRLRPQRGKFARIRSEAVLSRHALPL
jgi:hypothetical protein